MSVSQTVERAIDITEFTSAAPRTLTEVQTAAAISKELGWQS